MTFSVAEVELDTPVFDSTGEPIGRVDQILSLPAGTDREAAMESGAPDHQFVVVDENPILPWKPVLYIPFSAIDTVNLGTKGRPAGLALKCSREDAERMYQQKPVS